MEWEGEWCRCEEGCEGLEVCERATENMGRVTWYGKHGVKRADWEGEATQNVGEKKEKGDKEEFLNIWWRRSELDKQGQQI